MGNLTEKSMGEGKKEFMRISELRKPEQNVRKHDTAQIREYAKSLDEFGQLRPLVIDEENTVLCGNGMMEAMKSIGWENAEVLRKTGLSQIKKKRMMMADNRVYDLGEDDLDTIAQWLEECGDDVPGYSEEEMDDFLFELDDEPEERYNEPTEHQKAQEFFQREEKDYDSTEGQSEEYAEFVDKFKPKKTSDDCYTPENVYQAVADWVCETYGLKQENFVRPFYPGGDYQKYEYSPESVVVDNPPFSIFSDIVRWYVANGIRFFLFSPALTLPSCIMEESVTHIAAHASITYENTAVVCTSFTTNLDDPAIVLRTAPDLCKKIEEQDEINQKAMKKEIPKYHYPDNILTAAIAGYFNKHGIDYRLRRDDCALVDALDAQKEVGKTIFGKGLLLSSRAAAERAAAERAAAERAAATRWKLSDRELAIIAELGKEKA